MKLAILLFLISPTLADLKILSLPWYNNGPEPCARTCSGVSKYDDADEPWQSQVSGISNTGRPVKIVDISGCNFVSNPVVTTTVYGLPDCPNVKVTSVRIDKFYAMSVEKTTTGYLKSNYCWVSWTANGFTCKN